MAEAILKVVLMLCFAALVLVACSEEPNRADREEVGSAPQRTPAQNTSARSTASGKTAAQGRVASEYVEDEGVLAVEKAELQRGQTAEEDQIVVQAVIRGREGERGCFLMERPDWFALRRIIQSGAALPGSPRQAGDIWGEQLPADDFSGGDTYVGFFPVNPKPDGEKLDLRETPLFAFCYVDADPGGTSAPTAWYDVAHVEGTTEASP